MTSAIVTPVRFSASSYVINVKLGSTSEDVTIDVTIGRDYWLTGDAAADTGAGNGDLLTVITDAITAQHSNGGSGILKSRVIFVDGSPFVQFERSGASDVRLNWTAGSTTFDPTILGWTAGADSDEDATIIAPNRCDGLWLPGAKYGPDSRDRISTLRGTDIAMDGTVYTSDFGDSAKRRDLTWELLDQSVILAEYAADPQDAFELYWRDSISKGRRFRVYEDADPDILDGTFGTYVKTDTTDPMERNGTYPKRWDVSLRMVAA
jgi:hypothetical protein